MILNAFLITQNYYQTKDPKKPFDVDGAAVSKENFVGKYSLNNLLDSSTPALTRIIRTRNNSVIANKINQKKIS